MKIKSEKEMREGLLRYAKKIGAEEDLKHLFSKWDRLIALAPPSEKQEMAQAAVLEVQNFLDIHSEDHNGLTVDGKVVIAPKGN